MEDQLHQSITQTSMLEIIVMRGKLMCSYQHPSIIYEAKRIRNNELYYICQKK